jgi:hypothetical protein
MSENGVGHPPAFYICRGTVSDDSDDSGQEDVKKWIPLSFRDFIFDPKCLPTAQRSLIRHPGAIFLR